MSQDVFGFEVGTAATDGNFLKRWWVKHFGKNQYRFRITEAPGLTNERAWGTPSKIRIPDPTLEYLPFQFPAPEKLEEIGREIASAIFKDE